MNNSGGPLNNQTWQTEWKTASLAKVQLCEYENQTLEAFVAASCSYIKYDCAVAHQNFSLLATHVHDCESCLFSTINKHLLNPTLSKLCLTHSSLKMQTNGGICFMCIASLLLFPVQLAAIPWSDTCNSFLFSSGSQVHSFRAFREGTSLRFYSIQWLSVLTVTASNMHKELLNSRNVPVPRFYSPVTSARTVTFHPNPQKPQEFNFQSNPCRKTSLGVKKCCKIEMKSWKPEFWHPKINCLSCMCTCLYACK